MSGSDWCYATDRYGDNWAECESAKTKEEAIVEAVEYAKKYGYTTARVGWKRQCTHADFVGGLGRDVREMLCDRACDVVGDLADEYPDVGPDFDKALDAFVLDYLREHASSPLFFAVEGIEEIPVP